MNNALVTSNSSTFKAQPVQVTMNPGSVESPSAWMQYGTSPTEIILATAVVIGAIAGVVVSIAFLLQVLVPAMQKNSTQAKK
ncbi:hypothetical protein K9N68_04050 [Kovacikia minuta CCNUW1]|uniref:hypothetical protein n=1 Tax=Kovacikia minuta TaxID=2931930 RepID=UPI001CCF0F01|nr:hypothetical protein [Kovacikia minuta]UBF27147.1 hypothetical protein K9N68_04050 [Kovacikia minuta CCNUW1]